MACGRPDVRNSTCGRTHAQLSLPVSLVGQDRRLSPARPGFNSRTGKMASRAPLAERSAVNRQVLGSIPSGGDYLFVLLWCVAIKCAAQINDITNPWRNGSASDSRPEGWGFKSLLVHFDLLFSNIWCVDWTPAHGAHRAFRALSSAVERRIADPEVTGSIPVVPFSLPA